MHMDRDKSTELAFGACCTDASEDMYESEEDKSDIDDVPDDVSLSQLKKGVLDPIDGGVTCAEKPETKFFQQVEAHKKTMFKRLRKRSDKDRLEDMITNLDLLNPWGADP